MSSRTPTIRSLEIGGHGPARTIWNQPGVAFERGDVSLAPFAGMAEARWKAVRVARPGGVARVFLVDALHPVWNVIAEAYIDGRERPVDGDPPHKVTYEYWNSSDNTTATCTCGWIDRWPGADGSAQQSGAAHEQRSNR